MDQTPKETEEQLRATCFRVKATACENCLFGPDRLVDEETKAAILAETTGNDTFFICHEASWAGQVICCRGYWNRYKQKVADLRLVQALGRLLPGSLRFVEPLEGEEDNALPESPSSESDKISEGHP